MSTPGDPPPPPPRHPPPPQGWVGPPGPASYVDVDPASAGLVREERLGWALPFALLGALSMVVALFLPWIETQIFVNYDNGVDGPLEDRREVVGLLGAIDTVRDVTGPAPDVSDPGALAGAFYPWLAIALTVVCCLLALAAAVGLRRAALTNTVRIVGVLAAIGAVAVAVLALLSLGLETQSAVSPTVTRPGGVAPPSSEPTYIGGEVQPWAGFAVWFWGAVLLALGAALGPRVVHKLPAGAQPAYGGSLGTPGWSSARHPGLVRHTTQVVTIVVVSIGTVVTAAGYTFLSWAQEGETVTFAEIGEAARVGGFGDRAYAEAYFGWLGWVVLVWVLLTLLLVVLGKKPAGVNPRVLKPFLVIGAALAVVAHVAALSQLEGGVGPAGYAVMLGLPLILLGTTLPLRTTARVAVGQYPGPGGPG